MTRARDRARPRRAATPPTPRQAAGARAGAGSPGASTGSSARCSGATRARRSSTSCCRCCSSASSARSCSGNDRTSSRSSCPGSPGMAVMSTTFNALAFNITALRETRDPQARARHAAADLGLPGRDRRQRGHQHRAADPDHHGRRPPAVRARLAAGLAVAGVLRRRRRDLLRLARRRALSNLAQALLPPFLGSAYC